MAKNRNTSKRATGSPAQRRRPSPYGTIHLARDESSVPASVRNLLGSFLRIIKDFLIIIGRLQVEIDSVIGRDRFPEFDDEGVLPYTAATITEIYHYHSMTALGITHSTTCDTEFGGYFIPKKTPVIFNLQSANYDEKVFNNPEK